MACSADGFTAREVLTVVLLEVDELEAELSAIEEFFVLTPFIDIFSPWGILFSV